MPRESRLRHLCVSVHQDLLKYGRVRGMLTGDVFRRLRVHAGHRVERDGLRLPYQLPVPPWRAQLFRREHHLYRRVSFLVSTTDSSQDSITTIGEFQLTNSSEKTPATNAIIENFKVRLPEYDAK